jgi:hypothetical protein
VKNRKSKIAGQKTMPQTPRKRRVMATLNDNGINKKVEVKQMPEKPKTVDRFVEIVGGTRSDRAAARWV